ncbi:hypothetical protein DPMN_020376 [Dreissena polymorpha]|uniref:Uncharacterized protein n=1 Tax=Dreissena polymorpha TaxID=45954 RepID=A0A9D4SA53_DREPO|nr:hypothetical protein DPMN_020376 [Dreissena polymorpha]
MRTFFQVHEWIENGENLSPTEWGFELRVYAPENGSTCCTREATEMVKCKCKQHCDTKRCTCRKNGRVFCGMLRMSWNQLYKCREV